MIKIIKEDGGYIDIRILGESLSALRAALIQFDDMVAGMGMHTMVKDSVKRFDGGYVVAAIVRK